MKAFLVLMSGFAILLTGLNSAWAADPSSQEDGSFRCRANADCRREGLRGICQNPGKPEAMCVYVEVHPVPLEIILPSDCRVCNTDLMVGQLSRFFPELRVSMLSAESSEGRALIERNKITTLPAYFLGKQAEQEPAFDEVKSLLAPDGDRFRILPEFSGVAYFLDRTKKADRLDVFLGITHPDAGLLLKLIKGLMDRLGRAWAVNIQLVAKHDKEYQEFISPGGMREINEGLIYACADKYAPARSLDYLMCRTDDIDSLFWQDCLDKSKIDVKRVTECVRSAQGKELLAEKTTLSQELGLLTPSFILLNNVEIFGTTAQTDVDGLVKVVNPTNKK